FAFFRQDGDDTIGSKSSRAPACCERLAQISVLQPKRLGRGGTIGAILKVRRQLVAVVGLNLTVNVGGDESNGLFAVHGSPRSRSGYSSSSRCVPCLYVCHACSVCHAFAGRPEERQPNTSHRESMLPLQKPHAFAVIAGSILTLHGSAKACHTFHTGIIHNMH